jgi:hypothetical protein
MSRRRIRGDNTVFGFQFSVKRFSIINELAIRFVASETELGIIPPGRALIKQGHFPASGSVPIIPFSVFG